MCGFAGIVAFEGSAGVDRAALGEMSARLAHRGPDGSGLVLIEPSDGPAGPSVGLVHRRLAILDLDPRADQPWTDGQGRWIVFNGEIYNFRALRAELTAIDPGRRWRTECDTEVLLAAYGAWGEDCCRRLEGMFAFAIWDAPRRRLVLGRDRMGQKPLFYTRLPASAGGGEALAFASELSALRAAPGSASAIDPQSLIEYLRVGYLVDRSIYRGVAPAPASTCLVFEASRAGEPRAIRYFDCNAADAPASDGPTPGAGARTTRRLVNEAVRGQLVSDAPLGCFLSGGIDSSIVVAAVCAASAGAGKRVKTFTIAFDDPRYDESSYAAAVARHLGTEHRQFLVRPEAAADLPRLAEAFGEPFGDSSALPTHYLSRATREFVKVALSGDGGDELFGGYDRYRAMLLGGRIDALPAVRYVLESPVWQCLPGAHPKGQLSRLKRFLAPLADSPAARYARYTALFDGRSLGVLLRDGVAEGAGIALPPQGAGPAPSVVAAFEAARRGDPSRGVGPRDDVQAALAVDRAGYLPGDLLTKLDRCSMLHGLEVRSPFMDSALVRFAAGLTTSQLLRGGPKRMLREAYARDLPASVFKRRKMGFAVPIGDWFRQPGHPLRTLLRDALLSSRGFSASWFRPAALRRLMESHDARAADHSQRLYALLMIELWHQTQGAPAPVRT